MQILLYIAGFGAMGCVARYLIAGWVYTLAGKGFPYGTLAVNILGAFLIGLVMEFGLRGALLPVPVRTGIGIGFLGGLTTFSTFSYETLRLLEEGEFFIASTNILLSVATCLLCTWLGIMAARSLYL